MAAWYTDPRVLWFSEGDHVEERSIVEVQGIYRGVSQAAEVFVVEHLGVPIGDGWVRIMDLPRITTRPRSAPLAVWAPGASAS